MVDWVRRFSVSVAQDAMVDSLLNQNVNVVIMVANAHLAATGYVIVIVSDAEILKDRTEVV